MPITQRELLAQYGNAARIGNATIFVGAGLSLSAGYPTWPQLLEKPRRQAKVPKLITDLPLVAEYVEQSIPGGRDTLESLMLGQLSKVDGQPTNGHRWLSRLPLEDIWTTNYDCLIEQVLPEMSVVSRDGDLTDRTRLQRRRIMKMHGSLTSQKPIQWLKSPVITRRDYEEYENRNPRLWAALRATYLTKSILFLGFSFTDPNIEVLLRLSRTLLNIGAPEHYTILRAPEGAAERRMHDLQVQDLEKSGVAVCEISDFATLEPFLKALVRRTCQRVLFVSGSTSGDSDISDCSRALGYRLSEWNVQVVSLAGPSAMRLSYRLGSALLAENRYDPERARFYFRQSPEKPPAFAERIGTAIYSGMDKEHLCESVLAQCRAMVIIGGGQTTRAEFEVARSLGVPVVPLACSKGVAKEIWQEMTDGASAITDGAPDRESQDWNLLNNDEIDIAVGAAIRLLTRSMYLDDSKDRAVTPSR